MSEAVTNEMLAQDIKRLVRSHEQAREENREDHQRIFDCQDRHGQRITACETDIRHLDDSVVKTAQNTNGTGKRLGKIAEQVALITGKTSTTWRIGTYAITAAIGGGLAIVINLLIGG